MKKKMIAGLMATALVASMMTGCGSSSSDSTDTSAEETEEEAEEETEEAEEAAEEETEEEAEEEETTSEVDYSALSGTVSTDGSTSMEKMMEITIEVFAELAPNVTVSYNPTGSGSGITAVAEGSADIGLASRDLKDEEVEQGLTGTIVAKDGICVVVNTENTVSELTLDEISAIFSGEITNWSEVGGEDGEIVVIGREAGSGTRDGFESITDTEDICVYSQELTSTGAVLTAVEGNPNAIGYASLASVDESVIAVSVDGVEPSEDTVSDGSYPIQRNFVFVTNDNTELSEQAQAFYDWITGGEADEYITQAGVVPYHDGYAEETEEETEEESEEEETAAEVDYSALSGTVSTDGSTSMEKMMEITIEVFAELAPNVTVSYNPTGSGSGITAVAEGSADIGLASRDLKDEEEEQGLTGTVVAKDGICVVVNTENTVSELTLDEIAAIFSGEITNWSEVGGEDGEIVVIGREAGSGTRDGFESITDTEDICVYSQELTSTGAVITAVEGNPNAIGYASLASVDETVTALTVDGVEPSEDTVKDGSYPIQRNFVFVTNDNTELSEQAQAFYDWITGGEADEYITQAGVVPYHE